MMARTLLLAIGLCAFAIYFFEIRVIVSGPMRELNKGGATLIVANGSNMPLLSSPQSFCTSQGKFGDDMCAAGALYGMIGRTSTLLQLPYSQTLSDLAEKSF